MQVITSTGFGDSGSSAVTDLISEYDGIKSYGSEWECTFLHAPDGLGDLEEAVKEGHRLKVDFAISKFLELSKRLNNQIDYNNTFKGKFFELSKNFVEEFTDAKWNGMYEDRLPFFESGLNKKQKKYIKFAKANYKISKSKQFDMYESDSWRPNYIACTDMYYACNLQKFYDCAKKYTHALFELAAEGAERLYLDQLVPPISINKYKNYFDDQIKVFIVDKDPRDLFIVENLYNGSRYVPYENVKVFINWYNSTRSKSLESKNDEYTYFCKLDDLVFDYENQCTKIENYLSIKSDLHTHKLKHFDPHKSCVNIRLYEKYDNFQNEVQQIEKQLNNFLSSTYAYGNGVDKKDIKHFENPIVSVMKQCNEIQNGKIINHKIQIAFNCTLLVENVSEFSNRKSMKKMIKGLIKIFIGIIIFIPEFIYNIFQII